GCGCPVRPAGRWFALAAQETQPTMRMTIRAVVTRTRAGGDVMLTRRGFAGVASCAICGVAGFIATDASAQGAQPATSSGGVTRQVLSQIDGPVAGYTTIVMDVTIEAGVAVARHTHPGIESSYVMEGGGGELP